MIIHVRLAEPFWRPTGQREHQLELSEGSIAGDLLIYLIHEFPELGKEFQETPPHIFSGEEEISLDDALEDSQRIHLVWPIAGG